MLPDLSRALLVRLVPALAAIALAACSSADIKPVDIYPEDACSWCRMAISDERCASECIDDQGDVHKFDDLGCYRSYVGAMKERRAVASYAKDYETKAWIPLASAVIVETDVRTPMGSGSIAFRDPERARKFQQTHPASK